MAFDARFPKVNANSLAVFHERTSWQRWKPTLHNWAARGGPSIRHSACDCRSMGPLSNAWILENQRHSPYVSTGEETQSGLGNCLQSFSRPDFAGIHLLLAHCQYAKFLFRIIRQGGRTESWRSHGPMSFRWLLQPQRSRCEFLALMPVWKDEDWVIVRCAFQWKGLYGHQRPYLWYYEMSLDRLVQRSSTDGKQRLASRSSHPTGMYIFWETSSSSRALYELRDMVWEQKTSQCPFEQSHCSDFMPQERMLTRKY